MKSLLKNNKGSMLIIVLTMVGLFLALSMGAIALGILQMKLNIRKVAKAQALHVAEAGVNYYRWVLYHDDEEYCNNETCQPSPDYGPYGPYEYVDSSGLNKKGFYELYIIPPATDGSTIVTIKSIGWTEEYPTIKRTIEVQCGIPSWSSFSTLANSAMRFGAGTEVWGPIHSNGGIRFDGLTHNLITSSLLDYDDPDHTGSNEFGVHTHVDPPPGSGVDDSFRPLEASPNPISERSDVFMAGRDFPVTTISFDLLDNYINETLVKAQNDGIVLESSGDDGYHVTFNIDDTIDIQIVTQESSSCTFSSPYEQILNETPYITGTSTPSNGIIFIKDKVWVDGSIDGNRITLLAFEEPIAGDSTDIIIDRDITYTNYDGSDAIGLIAQNNITIGYDSKDDLRIDAALIAKEGRIGRNHYGNWCGASTTRSTITTYGALATGERYGFAYTDGSGYTTRNLIYDNNLTYSPPPHYPTTGEYTFISWKEK